MTFSSLVLQKAIPMLNVKMEAVIYTFLKQLTDIAWENKKGW